MSTFFVHIHIPHECVAVCCSVLQCVAVCCSVLQCVHVYTTFHVHIHIPHSLYTYTSTFLVHIHITHSLYTYHILYTSAVPLFHIQRKGNPLYPYTAHPTWGDIFECSCKAQSSKFERLFTLKRGKRDVRALSFDLSKMSTQVGLAVLPHSMYTYTHHILYTHILPYSLCTYTYHILLWTCIM